MPLLDRSHLLPVAARRSARSSAAHRRPTRSRDTLDELLRNLSLVRSAFHPTPQHLPSPAGRPAVAGARRRTAPAGQSLPVHDAFLPAPDFRRTPARRGTARKATHNPAWRRPARHRARPGRRGRVPSDHPPGHAGRFFVLSCAPAGIEDVIWNARICHSKKKLLCVPIYMNNETVHGILPFDLSAIAWSSRWSPPHRSNRSCKPSHHVARSLDRLIGTLPRLSGRIATGAWALLALSRGSALLRTPGHPLRAHPALSMRQ